MEKVPFSQKSSVEEIRARFDADVERFSQLETGQSATIDAPLAMELITQAAAGVAASGRPIRRVLDVGCGAGNNTLKLWEAAPGFAVDLLDLSAPMLARAEERLHAAGVAEVRSFQADLRDAPLDPESYDVVIAAAVLHHLRDDADWRAAFEKIYAATAPGGSVWITDLVSHELPAVQDLLWRRYGEYLADLGGEAYRDQVFAYIAAEDSPRSAPFHLDLLREVGFASAEILHKNGPFAAFGAVKAG
ncbi:MAG: class I SAM-dependent methyltransferase [Verrucomicrobiota bacterium]